MNDGTKKEIYAMDEFEREEYRCEVKKCERECRTKNNDQVTFQRSNKPM